MDKLDTTTAGLIVSIITAIGLFLKIVFDNRFNSINTQSSYLRTLVENIESLSKQNKDLQTQIDGKQEQIDELKAELDNILNGKYQIILDITAGKRVSIDQASIKNVLAE